MLAAAAWHQVAAGPAPPSSEGSGPSQRVLEGAAAGAVRVAGKGGSSGSPQWGETLRAGRPSGWGAGGSRPRCAGPLRSGGGPECSGPRSQACTAPGKGSAGAFPRLAGAGQGGGRCRRFPIVRDGPGLARSHERLRLGGAAAQPGGGGRAAGGRTGLGGGQGLLRRCGYPEGPAGECQRVGGPGGGWGPGGWGPRTGATLRSLRSPSPRTPSRWPCPPEHSSTWWRSRRSTKSMGWRSTWSTSRTTRTLSSSLDQRSTSSR